VRASEIRRQKLRSDEIRQEKEFTVREERFLLDPAQRVVSCEIQQRVRFRRERDFPAREREREREREIFSFSARRTERESKFSNLFYICSYLFRGQPISFSFIVGFFFFFLLLLIK